MTATSTFDRVDTDAASPPRTARAEDMAMLRTAAELTRDLGVPSRAIYWSDMLASAAIGYGGLAAAILLHGSAAWIAGVVAVLALYRAGSFIHELTHYKTAALPGFRFAWNAIVGVPLLVPSFLYEGVHTLHHARTRYGTALDPEYLPLALMRPWTVPLFVAVSALAPIALLFRFAVLTPLSLLSPALRRIVVERYSGLQINPGFRRSPPTDALGRYWPWQEGAASLWAIALIALIATGVVPVRTALIMLGVTSGVLVLNQVRTLVAHLWENDGEALSVTAQYLDSVNVPAPGLLPALWAPVGLRYHALHHLLPSLPYHALAEAHRRLAGALGPDSPYHGANYGGLGGLLVGLLRSSSAGTPIPRR